MNRSSFVALTSTGAHVFVWLYYAATATLALWSIGDSTQPWLVVLVLALFAGAVLALTLDRGDRLSLPVAVGVSAVAAASIYPLSWQLVPGGYTAWYVGAATALLFMVNLRGRIAVGWAGCAAMVTALILWGVTTPIGLADAITISARQSAIVGVATLTALALQRTGGRIRELTAEASVRSADEAAGIAVAEERARRLADLRSSAVPLLQRIAGGGPITDEDRGAFAVAEADLRDSLRARGLRVPEIMDAAREARRRGVDVVLLDDSGGDLAGVDLPGFVALVTEALTSATDGRVTARLLPPGRPVFGTVVADGSVYSKREALRD
ncbi:MAG: hypothetical protein J0J03_08635 [Leifsonia sp.]|nr:hypothetical protein [Leifsonia sp.]